MTPIGPEKAAWLTCVRLAQCKNERFATLDHDSNLAKIVLQRAHVRRLKARRGTLDAAPADKVPNKADAPVRDGAPNTPGMERHPHPGGTVDDLGVLQLMRSAAAVLPLTPTLVASPTIAAPPTMTAPPTITAPAPAPTVASAHHEAATLGAGLTSAPAAEGPVPRKAPFTVTTATTPATARGSTSASIDAIATTAAITTVTTIAAARRLVIQQMDQQRPRRLRRRTQTGPIPLDTVVGAIAAARRLVIQQMDQQRPRRLRPRTPGRDLAGRADAHSSSVGSNYRNLSGHRRSMSDPAGMARALASVDITFVANVGRSDHAGRNDSGTVSVDAPAAVMAAMPSIAMVNARHMVRAGC